MGKRQFIDDRINHLRFLLDRTRLDYQPLPWLGAGKAPRSHGVHSRWHAISRAVDDVGGSTAIDIGCNAGFFVISLAQCGIATVGIESDERYARLLVHARRRLDLGSLGVLLMRLSPSTVPLLPSADITVMLSVWHHLVRAHGLPSAMIMLSDIWSLTRKLMFFETGQDEMPADWGLPPMGPDPRAFLADMLGEHCPGSRVEHLGLHAAFDADRRPCERSLFAVIRKGADDH